MRQPARPVTPRNWALLATTSALMAISPLSVTTVAGPAGAQTADDTADHAPRNASAETGESGEAGSQHEDPAISFQTELGLFESAYRIVAALYARGEPGEAWEQLQGSHHAFYDDLQHRIDDTGALDFKGDVTAFAEAVENRAAPETVEALYRTLLARIDVVRAASHAGPRDQVMALHLLLNAAAGDFGAGVDAGQILSDHEYRDAWGFFAVVQARAEALRASDDPALSQAGADLLARLEPARALFPDLLAPSAPGDVSVLNAAAGWAQIIALRLPD